MGSAIVALFVVLSVAGSNADRVVGGTEAADGQFPYMVYLANDGRQFCGGSILSETWTISAAHCNPKKLSASYTVVAGDYKVDIQTGDYSQNMAISSIVEHPDYNTRSLANDIMLINLKSPLEYNEKVGAIAMQKAPVDGGLSITISGWGSISSGGPYPDFPRYAYVKSFATAACKGFYPTEIEPGMICMGIAEGGIDTCQGDSGGPAVLNTNNPGVTVQTLAGITSWGYGCADAGNPGVYTDVQYYNGYIVGVTGI